MNAREGVGAGGTSSGITEATANQPRQEKSVYRPANIFQRIGYRFIRFIVRCWYLVYHRARVEGKENLPEAGPCLILATHASFLDPPLVGVMVRPSMHFLARTEITSWPVLGPLVSGILNTHPIRRGAVDRKAIKMCAEILKAGQILLIFPEGTRSWDGKTAKPLAGFGMILDDCPEATCLPVYIIDTHRGLGRGKRFPRPAKIVMRVGPKFQFEPRGADQPRRDFHEQCAQRLEEEWRKLGAYDEP
jgi:1-acyl-sn-glycerol-3-phosphate acyltransferase